MRSAAKPPGSRPLGNGACSKYAHEARGPGIFCAPLRRNLNVGSERLYYKGSKSNLMASKFFRAVGTRFSHILDAAAPDTPPRALGVRGVQRFAGVCFAEEERARVHGGGAIRIERILNLALVLIFGNKMSLSFTVDCGANPTRAREGPVI